MPSRSRNELDIGKQIGTSIKDARESIGWPQRELARRLATNQSKIQRLESGFAQHLDARLASAAFGVLGIRMSLDNATAGLAQRREQRDFVHARCCGHVAHRLPASGWEVLQEVEIGSGRYRGWIDLLAFRAADRCLLCIEVKTELDDLGRIQRIMGWYEREAWAAARRAGWRPAMVRSVLVVLMSAENDARIQANRSMLLGAFPGRPADLGPWVADSTAKLPPWPAMALVDPRSRRTDWLRPSRTDGRRSPAPYADYRDAAGALRGRVVRSAPATPPR